MRPDLSATERQVSRGQPESPDPGLFGVKRGVAIAIAASAIFHVSVLLVLDGIDPPPRPPPPPAVKLGLTPLPPPIPIDVTMVAVTPPEPPAVAPAVPPPTSSEPAPRRPMRPDVAEPSRQPMAPTAPAPPGRPSPPSMMTMRHGRDAIDTGERTAVPDGAGDPGAPVAPGRLAALGLGSLTGPDRRDYAFDPDGPQPYEAPSSGELRPDGDGTHRTRRPGFTGRVKQDGSISLEDGKSFDAEWRLPNPKKLGKRAARGVENWFRDPFGQVKAQQVDKSTCHKGGGDGTNNCLVASDYGAKELSLDGVAEYTRRPDDDGERGDDTVTIPIVGGRTELTDAVMRAVGQDPYLSDKLRWMDATREERAAIGLTHRRRQLDQVDQTIRKHLAALWARRDLDLAAKREALFELWDDGAEEGDQAVVEAAQRARNQVVAFIRRKLPAGGATAYTPAELDALNRRRTSRARFEPY